MTLPIIGLIMSEFEERTRFMPQNLRDLCDCVLGEPDFQECPGGVTRHHVYKHGLAQHTLEVLRTAQVLTSGLGYMSRQRVTLAAVFHDCMKTREYGFAEDGTTVVAKPFRKLIGHVAASWGFFCEMAPRYDLPFEETEEVGHIMLAHHGRHEWRSPVEPKTIEAFILHAADMLSMQAAGGEDKK